MDEKVDKVAVGPRFGSFLVLVEPRNKKSLLGEGVERFCNGVLFKIVGLVTIKILIVINILHGSPWLVCCMSNPRVDSDDK